MDNLRIIDGNIFTTQCQTIVNTVNCVGVMGAGIAFEFKLRLPEMFNRYTELCSKKALDIGKLWLYRDSTPWVLNFPTKRHWKMPSRESYLHAGLEKFTSSHQLCGIKSIAFPLLGASKGGISPDKSLDIMINHLAKCEIPVEIYRHDPMADDDLFQAFRKNLLETDHNQLKADMGIRSDRLKLLIDAVSCGEYRQMNQLIQVPGIGQSTLEKAFKLVQVPAYSQTGFNF